MVAVIHMAYILVTANAVAKLVSCRTKRHKTSERKMRMVRKGKSRYGNGSIPTNDEIISTPFA